MSSLAAFAPLLVDEPVVALVDDEALAMLAQRLETLPIASAGGFECPLGRHREGASFSVRLTAQDAGLPEPARALLDPGGVMGGAVEEVWLEADADADVPHTFVRFTRTYGQGRSFGAEPEERLEQTLAAIAAFCDTVGAQRADGLVRRCVEGLPAPSRIAFVGAMLGRDGGLRLTVGRVPLNELTAFLGRIGWLTHHPVDPLLDVLRVLRPDVRYAGVHLDVGPDELGPRIGLGIAPDPPAASPEWDRLLQVLQRTHVCSAEEVRAISDWPRRFHEVMGDDRWPGDLDDDRDDLQRSINHVKLVHDAAEERLYAKAYLAYTYGYAFPDPTVWET